MSRFSETLMDHFQSPRNCGRLETADRTGVAGVPGQGRFLVLYLRVGNGRIVRASFECNGCGVTIATGSVLTELVNGKTLEDCGQLTATDVVKALDGLPFDKLDRADFAIAALQDALRDKPPVIAHTVANTSSPDD